MKFPSSIPNSKLIFLHLPKTAGTTVHNHFVGIVGQDETCWARFDNVANRPRKDIDKFRFYSGHYSISAVNYIPGNKFVFTFVRDPKERIRSLHKYWRSRDPNLVAKRNKKGPALAIKYPFEEFIFMDDPVVHINFDNAVTRTLAGISLPTMQSLKAAGNQELIIRMAKQNLDRLFFIGDQGNFERDFNRLLRILDLPNVEKFEHAKQTSKSPDDTQLINTGDAEAEKLMARLDELTGLDQQIYEYAISKTTFTDLPF